MCINVVKGNIFYESQPCHYNPLLAKIGLVIIVGVQCEGLCTELYSAECTQLKQCNELYWYSGTAYIL